MALFYDARGNIYGVVSPAALRYAGIAVPECAALAARTRSNWTSSAIAAECSWGSLPRPAGAKAHRCDGLLVGPFQAEPPFDLLIVNTDGSLAERSGNGLTIFAQALTDQSLMSGACELRVHHDKPDVLSPVTTRVEAAVREQVAGFWLELGVPGFGPEAVGAQTGVDETEPSHVSELAAINPQWATSQFVRVGNPHCVTLVEQVSALPDNLKMQQPALYEPLKAIAFAPPAGGGRPCAAGINLQWAARQPGNRVFARVFERGEGPTASSGTSASAVACAAWRAGWIESGEVEVVMPGGIAPVRLQTDGETVLSVSLFGAARLQA
ncbi:diaminopimelate epimerase [Pseudomonas reactans]|uniref:Diaminopimelate epimerase n=1 Tax=Pseudomonas reactans TaxID=117680 RepID=A0ABX2QVX6_9PSED|nr:diaminopimelate epimerase [Pseudomonas reactans]NWA46325.1 diaminopimelate epimerase [Pseudomonas reactans]NWC89926.1 diaminopimelate epimerase [Pseudomonas reactans]NWD32912.1 diaminopimelate epimerase [Pseudomonas reactans]NWD95016.1 diaminopimelate epimerase [Pseudomonas reactans]NWF16537.1 diaminopimelate epimerase [Pseudomonas reactans]